MGGHDTNNGEDVLGTSGSDDADDGDGSGTSEDVRHSDAIGDGPLILAVAADYPPYAYIDDDGNVAGIDVDIANEIAKTYGVELEVHDMPFDALSVGAFCRCGGYSCKCHGNYRRKGRGDGFFGALCIYRGVRGCACGK